MMLAAIWGRGLIRGKWDGAAIELLLGQIFARWALPPPTPKPLSTAAVCRSGWMQRFQDYVARSSERLVVPVLAPVQIPQDHFAGNALQTPCPCSGEISRTASQASSQQET